MDEQVKIWQRVRGNAPPVTDGLPGLTAGALSRAALYGTLARQMQGSARSILQQLQEDERHSVRCFKGIHRLITGTTMNVAPVPPVSEKAETALRKCYGQTLKALSACEARSYDAEYGPVFGMLASTMRANCCKLAELISLLDG